MSLTTSEALPNEATVESALGEALLESPLGITPIEVPEETVSQYNQYNKETLVDTLLEKEKAYENLQALQGRQGNELGQLRKTVDELLLSQTAGANTAEEDEAYRVDASDLLDNPTESLSKFVDSKTEEIQKQTLARIDDLELSLVQEKFKNRHPDYEQVARSQDFSEWLHSSPIRTRVAMQAGGGDYAAADELISEYKDNSVNTNSTVPTGSTVASARQASLESGYSSKASPGGRGKVYSRAKLAEIRLANPNLYKSPSFQEEMVKAYAEGRVK